MPSTASRRRLLASSAVALGSLAGCVSGAPDSETDTSPSPTRTPTRTDTDDSALRVDTLSVADFVLYPLAGVHPHVHRRSGMQYVLVRVVTSLDEDAVRKRLTLELDGASVPLAERQPVPWERETVDLAFAVSKTATVDAGRVLLDGTVRRSLAEATVERLNHPPVFEVGEPSVSPAEVEAGQRLDATIRADVTNVGSGRGTFGASLGSSYLSGSKTVTVALDTGAERELTGEIRIVGDDDAPTVRLDWGVDEWKTTVPVVGTATATGLSDGHSD